ncbi:hypothetical protein JS84_03990 [Vibrio vulnificus]|nr:hypothetical protein Y702_09630 [Vibrio vulnificus BAA87]KFK58921.1 hypothetical protein JS83_16230 [Vibrio vulnificus]KLI65647.1 hypothetical protein VVYB158_22050 [Vibrio vulnificus CladeA-yb158]KFK65880.1 hypothetical protein JS84_03990 [Vibrio vulnificus]KFK68905.1 hypothetical protein JS85_11920 [Vibrio vulnificus]
MKVRESMALSISKNKLLCFQCSSSWMIAPEFINSINQHGLFLAEMKERNAETHQAHIVVHPN